MNDAAARPAAVEDLALLGQLIELARLDRLNERGGAVLERLDPRPAVDHARITDDRELLALGLYADVAFGFAHAEVIDIDDAPIVHLYDIFVEPDARGVGIGEALLEMVFEWTRTKSAGAVDSVVLPGNREGKNFFERFGLVARAIHVYRALDADE